jgi:hypothetical protein
MPYFFHFLGFLAGFTVIIGGALFAIHMVSAMGV